MSVSRTATMGIECECEMRVLHDACATKVKRKNGNFIFSFHFLVPSAYQVHDLRSEIVRAFTKFPGTPTESEWCVRYAQTKFIEQ